jgi:predicted  nucleic acid-binding Zn-ribbon protein
MPNEAFYLAIVSAVVSVVTIFGVRVWDGLIKKQEQRAQMMGKEFDDGVERRKELIKEIDRLNGVITIKDGHITQMQGALDKARDTVQEWAIKYTKLEGQYLSAVEDLQKMTGDVSEGMSKIKHDIRNQNAAGQLAHEVEQMEKGATP